MPSLTSLHFGSCSFFYCSDVEIQCPSRFRYLRCRLSAFGMRCLSVERVCELRGKASESVVLDAAFPDNRLLRKGVVLELSDAGDAERAVSKGSAR